ncbi:hypothetical protein WN943_008080 [Citrus x changshan-huyou]
MTLHSLPQLNKRKTSSPCYACELCRCFINIAKLQVPRSQRRSTQTQWEVQNPTQVQLNYALQDVCLLSDGFGIIHQRCNRGWRASGPLRDVAGLPAHGSRRLGRKAHRFGLLSIFLL